jgi:hypothetical protein
MKLKPSHFCEYPWSSVLNQCEPEVIAVNIMKIQRRLGDNWGLNWEQYKAERLKDGGFSMKEKEFFDRVQPYVNTADGAKQFSPTWRKAAEKVQ